MVFTDDALAFAHVLVVDDDAALNAAVARELGNRGFQITSAFDGDTALELLRNRDFDAVLLDLALPRLHGLELLQRLHGEQVPRHPPVVVFSGDEESELARARAMGLDHVLRKPAPIGQVEHALLEAIANAACDFGDIPRRSRASG